MHVLTDSILLWFHFPLSDTIVLVLWGIYLKRVYFFDWFFFLKLLCGINTSCLYVCCFCNHSYCRGFCLCKQNVYYNIYFSVYQNTVCICILLRYLYDFIELTSIFSDLPTYVPAFRLLYVVNNHLMSTLHS